MKEVAEQHKSVVLFLAKTLLYQLLNLHSKFIHIELISILIFSLLLLPQIVDINH